MSLDAALDAVMELDYDSRETLIEIVKKRQIQERRKEIAKNGRIAKKSHESGNYKAVSASEAITELRKKLLD